MKVSVSLRIEVAAGPGENRDHRRERFLGHLVVEELADEADAARAMGILIRMPADHISTADASLINVAELVDQVVVPNVMPAARDRVVVVDRPNCLEWILRIRGFRVMDDGMLDELILLQPPLAVFLESKRLVRSPFRAADERRGRRDVVGGLGGDRRWEIGGRWSGTRIDEGERQSRDHRWVTFTIDRAIANRRSLGSAEER